jgi:hypothetical protein
MSQARTVMLRFWAKMPPPDAAGNPAWCALVAKPSVAASSPALLLLMVLASMKRMEVP